MDVRMITCRIKPYIQPFERVLALAELTQVSGAKPVPSSKCSQEFRVMTTAPLPVLVDRLAYWERVSAGQSSLTTQVLREATVNIARNGIPLDELKRVLPLKGNPALPNRRCLRYGPHGIHEYRGKFFPQLVRALLNWAGVRPGSLIADTMCGSGTTILEAALLGCRGVGLDLNPLSVFISQTKCEMLNADPTSITETYKAVHEKLLAQASRDAPGRFSWVRGLPAHDQSYLRRWFSEEVLRDLERIVAIIQSVRKPQERNLLWVCLSNVLRTVSWQKEDDLRVRREVKAEVDPIKEFLEEMHRSVRTSLAFLYQSRGAKLGEGIALEGDARTSQSVLKDWRGRIDAVVTSPPYATALPYLDTDRLSLIYLRLLPRSEHRRREVLMVGNREITDRFRRRYWEAYKAAKPSMPGAIVRLVDKVHRLNHDADVGFRRKNMAALLAKYFLDMREVFQGLAFLLKEEAPAFLVIGGNHTYAGGKRIQIDTASLLGELVESCGLVLEDSLPMDMLVSRDIFRNNASAAETILVCRRR